VDAQLLRPAFLSRVLRLYSTLAVWMGEIIDPTHTKLPLAETPPAEFAALPEFMLENMGDFLMFVSRFHQVCVCVCVCVSVCVCVCV